MKKSIHRFRKHSKSKNRKTTKKLHLHKTKSNYQKAKKKSQIQEILKGNQKKREREGIIKGAKTCLQETFQHK